ncbi:MAG: hypothetical protein DDT36_00647 [Firmicutes bacterium]|nr:hypothetical protein [Bacillota bacterium]
MIKKILAVFLVLSLTVTLVVASPDAQQSYSAEAACNGCSENVVSATQLQLLLAAENNEAIGHVVISSVFQALQGRVLPNAQFSVTTLADGPSVVSFEVLPANYNDDGVSFVYLELATFVVQNNIVVAAIVSSRVVGDRHVLYQRDLFSQRTVAIRKAEPMPDLGLPPQEIMPMPPVGETHTVSPGCWVCVERVYVPGDLDNWCVTWRGALCSYAIPKLKIIPPKLVGEYILACLAAVWASCWTPGRSYCAKWIFFNDCLTEFTRNPDAI